MRQVEPPNLQLGQIDIAKIVLDPRSRDDIPQILAGLQYIYCTPTLRQEVFDILKEVIPKNEKGQPVASDNGRPGMDQWQILVLGVLRLGINTDYDRLHELANQHKTVRQFLGHSDWTEETQYSLHRLQDNLRLFTPEILDRINQCVVRTGHRLVKKNPGKDPSVVEVHARGDSFVVETNVHYPTDLHLLLDAIRRLLIDGQRLAKRWGIQGWRQTSHHLRSFKQKHRELQQAKHRGVSADVLVGKVLEYLNLAQDHLDRFKMLSQHGDVPQAIEKMAELAEILKNQIFRRCVDGETIPHAEKVFSVFQTHTEWVVKGKAGVPMELGVRVHVVEDRDQFILYHAVAQNQTDEKMAVQLLQETKSRFPELASLSLDKGYHSKANQEELAKHVNTVVLPKKGRLNETEQQREQDPVFRALRRQHSAVESAINGLEHTGLDLCRDHGIEGFKRYVAMAVLARNIKRVGVILREQERERLQRKRGPYRKAA